MTYNELFEQVKKKKSFLCVGLDSDIKKLPQHLMGAEDPVYEFNKLSIDITNLRSIARQLPLKELLHIFEKTGRLFKRMKMEIGKKRQYFRAGITGFMLRRTSRFLREGRFLSRE
jgi:hypothetical protein